MNRELTPKQHALLERIAEQDAGALVIGWADDKDHGRGPIVALSDGRMIVANVTGHRRRFDAEEAA